MSLVGTEKMPQTSPHPPSGDPSQLSAFDLERWVQLPTLSDSSPPDFETFARRFSHRAVRYILIAIGVIALALWPTDWWIFADEPGIQLTYALWRGTLVLLIAPALWWLRRLEAQGTSPVLAATPVIFTLAAMSYYRLSGIDEGHLYLLSVMILPPSSIGFMVPLGQRVLVTVGTTLSALAGYGLGHPELHYAESMGVSLLLILTSSLFSIGIGHVIYWLAKRNYEIGLRMRTLASTDALTNVANRRAFLETASREMLRAQRYERPMSLVMLDLDHFKTINDTHGHDVGDQILKQVTRIIGENLRDGDTLGRLGGEEFAVVMPETGLGGCLEAAERIRVAVASADFTGFDAEVTVSLGCAELQPDDQGIRDPLRRADQALYAAKREGRDRVCAA